MEADKLVMHLIHYLALRLAMVVAVIQLIDWPMDQFIDRLINLVQGGAAKVKSTYIFAGFLLLLLLLI